MINVLDEVTITGAQMKAAISAAYGSGGSYWTNFVCHNVTYAQLAVYHGAARANTIMSNIGWQWTGFAATRYHTPTGGTTHSARVYEGGFWGDGSHYEMGP